MREMRFGARWLQFLVVVSLLLMVSGSVHVIAQVSAPSPSRAQVIAQGIQWIEAGEYSWQMETATAGPQEPASSPAMVSGGFIYATGDPLTLHEDYRDFSLLSSGQAKWAPADIPTQIIATGGNPSEFSVLLLTPAREVQLGASNQLFPVTQGDYNIQLTRGMLPAGAQDSFVSVNTMPWMLVVLEGEVSLAGMPIPAGTTATHVGDATIVAGQGAPATYLVVSIGDRVELPQAAAPGEVLVLFWDCAETDYPVEKREQCAQVWEPISASFTRFSQGTPLTRTDADATQLPDGSWIYEEMTAGEWEFQLIMPDGSTPPMFTVLGDAEEGDGQWYVTVEPGERSVANVMLYRTQASALTITFMECPEDWDPSIDMAECWMASNEPSLRIEEVTGQNVIRFTQWDAEMPNIGTYEFGALPAGVYLLEPEYNDVWTPESTYLLEGAYSDGTSWYVEVTADAPASVLVVRTASSAEGITPPTVATGHVVITQEECVDWTAESVCAPAESPWDVRLTNIDTGDVWMLSQWGYNSAPGQWIMQLPTGGYTVEVPDTLGWQLEYPGWVDVLNDQESYISVRGNPQP